MAALGSTAFLLRERLVGVGVAESSSESALKATLRFREAGVALALATPLAGVDRPSPPLALVLVPNPEIFFLMAIVSTS